MFTPLPVLEMQSCLRLATYNYIVEHELFLELSFTVLALE